MKKQHVDSPSNTNLYSSPTPKSHSTARVREIRYRERRKDSRRRSKQKGTKAGLIAMEAAVGAPSTTLRLIPNRTCRSRCSGIAFAMAKPQSNSKRGTIVFPVGEPGPRTATSPSTGSPPVKLLTRVEQLRLLTKAEKAGLLSAADKLGFSLSTIEQLGLLSKAEDLGVLSAATNPATPAALRTLSLALLAAGPAFVYLVPEDYSWELALQALVALLCVVGGSAAFAASSLVYDLQKS